MIYFEYNVSGSHIIRTDTIKDLEDFLDSKLHVHQHVDYVSSPALKLLGLIRVTSFSLPSIYSLLTSYFASVRSKLEYASVAWNTLPSSDASKLERIQRVFSLVPQSFLSTSTL
jgi:hypothetical protein